MDLNIRLEHADAPRCFAVNVDPEGCTCQPAVNVQIGGKARGWASRRWYRVGVSSGRVAPRL